jgi:hypothetical protein
VSIPESSEEEEDQDEDQFPDTKVDLGTDRRRARTMSALSTSSSAVHEGGAAEGDNVSIITSGLIPKSVTYDAAKLAKMKKKKEGKKEGGECACS